MLQQHLQNPKGLRLQSDAESMFPELRSLEIDLIGLKHDAPERMMRSLHGMVNWTERECITRFTVLEIAPGRSVISRLLSDS
jgi:hypothetical protein